MLQFKPIAIEHREKVAEYTCIEHYGTTESAFLDLYIWGKKFNTQVAFEDGFMFIRSGIEKEIRYLFPYGKGKLCDALNEIYKDAESHGIVPRMVGVTERMREQLEECMPGGFRYTEARDTFDYVYNAQDLITLPGKKLHSKRTNINKFMTKYGHCFRYEEITRNNLDEVYEFQKRWLSENSNEANAEALQMEMDAIERAINHYFELGIKGGLIRVNDKVAAYSMGIPLCHQFYLISIEKGDYQYDGIYQIINKLYAEHNCSGSRYVNREEDTGSPGLRRAKLSYQPAFLIVKYEVEWI